MSCYYSQFGEDQWIAENLALPSCGTFVDIGAGDGVTHSNTFYFEQLGWSGFCVEADPRLFDVLKRNRRMAESCAVSTTRGKRDYYLNKALPYLSGLLREGEEYYTVEVLSVTLQELLVKHSFASIDLLSVDVEGSEIDVLNSFDFEAFKPRIVIIEYNTFGMESKESEIALFFENRPYRIVHKTFANMIYLKNE